jgi:hypothetical protein
LVNPDYTRAIARIVSAVAPYRESREAVIAALRDLDAAGASAPALVDRNAGTPLMANPFAAQLIDALEGSWPAVARLDAVGRISRALPIKIGREPAHLVLELREHADVVNPLLLIERSGGLGAHDLAARRVHRRER